MLGTLVRGGATLAALALAPIGAVSAAVAVRDTPAADAEPDIRGAPAKENHGAFVKSKLDEGLRGRELADAIHAEKGNKGRGKGPPAQVGHGRKAR